MRIPLLLRRALFNVLYRGVAMRRPADQFIGKGPYMLRWWLFGTSKTRDEHGNLQPRRPFGRSFYLHCFLRSDDDRAKHDHPWPYTTMLLFGGYDEHRDEDATYLLDPCFFDWRGAQSIKVVDTRKHYDGPVNVIRHYPEGSVIRAKATDAHRVALRPQCFGTGWAQSACGRNYPHQMTSLPWMTDEQSYRCYQMWRNEEPAWTLFIGGKWERKWGFHCEHGWKHWRDFDHDNGCGEST